WDARIERSRNDFRMLLEAHRDEIARKDLADAATMVAYFYNMMFVGVLLHRSEGDGTVNSFPDGAEQFADELTDVVCGYLSVQREKKPKASRRRKGKAKQ